MSKIAHVQVRLTFPIGAKEIATISIYTTLDDNNFLWDTEGVQSFSVTPGHNPNFVSFSLKDKYRCRIGVKATATMVLPTADMSYLLG